MSIYQYEEAFGAWDKTSKQMRSALELWEDLYYRQEATESYDPCQRIAYSVVSKLVRSVFAEYQVSTEDAFCQQASQELNKKSRQAVEMALMLGSCYIKPCPEEAGFSFTLVPRNNVLIFGRDDKGNVTDMGTVAQKIQGEYYYTLLERRQVDEEGCLTIENRLYRSSSRDKLGNQVALGEVPGYGELADSYRYPVPVGSVGLVTVKTPMCNCVDGSWDGVSVYGPAAGLIQNIDENEAQLKGEFSRGESRIIASADMLRDKALEDHLFVGLDEDPEQVGITVFSPHLRHQAFLERKQEYLRNVESVIGLKRGLLSDANEEDKTATEIAASAADYSLTIMDFQRMWENALQECMALCGTLSKMFPVGTAPEQPKVSVDWGNGVLFDRETEWEVYRQMVLDGILKPEIALGWRFGRPCATEAQQAAIRRDLMPVGFDLEQNGKTTTPQSQLTL